MQKQKLLTKNSLDKLKLLEMTDTDIVCLPQSYQNLINDTIIAFKEPLKVSREVSSITIDKFKTDIIDFDDHFNSFGTCTKLQRDLKKMNHYYSVRLSVGGHITVNILSEHTDHALIGTIIHSINTFCHLFPYDYSGLVIGIILDDNKRDIMLSDDALQIQIKNMQKNSSAFTVSGVTRRRDKNILLTKREEIIKLLYHELVHYIGLDAVLVGHPYMTTWNINNKIINLSEAYTEYMSIILHSAYISVHLMAKFGVDPIQTFTEIISYEIKYSLLLTSSILQIYGYNSHNYSTFFTGNSAIPPATSPIATWEYIILRSQLFLQMNNILDKPWTLSRKDIKNIVQIADNHDLIIKALTPYFTRLYTLKNISYIAFDLNYTFI
jgi:hypothetical protein